MTTTATKSKRNRRPRTVAVECTTSTGWRWLKNNARGATLQSDNLFVVTDESDWTQSLQAAGGKEVA